MFIADSVCYSTNNRQLIKQVSLELVPGTVTALIGPNGAGKSTLLKLFCRELIPDSGKLTLNNAPLFSIAANDAAKLRSVLPQKSELLFEFQVFEIVEMGRLPYRRSVESSENSTIVNRSMRYADIEHLRDRYYSSLSGGEQQRVHLARVLSQIGGEPHTQGRYLFLDEPTSALDPEHQHSLLAQVHEFAQKNHVGVLLVIHDLNLASMYADKIAVMEQGEIKHYASPHKAISSEIIETTFNVAAVVQSNPFKDCPLVVTKQKTSSYSHL